MKINFQKMHGLGNDFVVLDRRKIAFMPSLLQIQSIAHRKTGIGCDQIIIIDPPRDQSADIFMRIYNADGGEVSACGNATRCVADYLAHEKNSNHIAIETAAGILECECLRPGYVSVDMGIAKFDWRDIPLSDARDTAAIAIDIIGAQLPPAMAVNIGNPHAVFFIDDCEKFDVARFGPQIERHKIFPEKTNVEFATVMDRTTIRMRVWERGVGITDACGTGACATGVAAARKNLTERKVTVILDGGRLEIEYLPDGHVIMSGACATSFSGEIEIA